MSLFRAKIQALLRRVQSFLVKQETALLKSLEFTFNLLQAYAISAIAHWDWPEAWPDLFGHLMQALTSGDGNLVHGAMRVLTGTTAIT